jgi:hypothetical protein
MKLNLAIILSISLPATHYHGTKDPVKLNLRAVAVPSTHAERECVYLKESYPTQGIVWIYSANVYPILVHIRMAMAFSGAD